MSSGSQPRRTYDAFISYSGESDEVLAPRLRIALHRLARPWYRRRASRVFCAPADLGANPRLWGALEQALSESRYLILLASPNSAKSTWVARELAWWREHRTPETLLMVLTDGTVSWDDEGADFDWARTNALSPHSAGYFREAPLWKDLRGISPRGRRLAPEAEARFRDTVASLGAAIHNRPKADLIGEDVRQHRRALRLAWSTAAVLLVLALAASLLGVIAREQTRVARANQIRAEHEAAVALSRYLGVQAEGQAGGNPQLSMLLSAAAWRTEPTVEARASVLAGAGRWRSVRAFLSDSGRQKINAMALSPDGSVLATAMDDGRVLLWDPESRTVRRTLTTGIVTPQSVAFTSTGKLIVGGDQGGLGVWDVASGERSATLAVEGYDAMISSLATSGEFLLASGDNQGKIVVWDLESGEPFSLLRGHQGVVTGLAFTSSASLLASAASDGTAKLWQSGATPEQDRAIATFKIPGVAGRQTPLAFSPDDRLIAAGAYIDSVGSVIVWDTRTRKEVHRLAGHYSTVRTLTFTGADGDLLASGSTDNDVLLWDVEEESILRRYEAHTGPVAALARGSDPRILYSAGWDGNVIVWDLIGDIVNVPGGAARAVSINPTTGKLISGGGDGKLAITSLDDADDTSEVPVPGGAAITSISTSRDGRQTAIGTREEVWLSEPDGSEATRLPSAPEHVADVTFSPDSRLLAAVGGDGLVLWDTATRKATAIAEEQFESVAFSPDGRVLAAGNADLGIWLWDVPASRLIATLNGHFNTAAGLEFSPDGTLLASAGLDGRVVLWDLASRTPRYDLTGHPVAVGRVTFAPDGQTLISGDLGGNVILWDVPRGVRLALLPDSDDQVLDLVVTSDGAQVIVAYMSGSVAAWPTDVASAVSHICDIVDRDFTELEREQYQLTSAGSAPCR